MLPKGQGGTYWVSPNKDVAHGKKGVERIMAQRNSDNPFTGLVDVVSDMNRMWDRGSGRGSSTNKQRHTHADAWMPSIDIIARRENLLIRCALPGMTSDDVEVTYAGSTLTIAGKSGFAEDTDDGCEFYTKELDRGRFRRNITLPHGITGDDISVSLALGLLDISIPRPSESAEPNRLKITNGR